MKKNHYFFFINMTVCCINILMIAFAVPHIYGFVGSRLRNFEIINGVLDSTLEEVANNTLKYSPNESIVLELVTLGNDSVDFKYSFWDKKEDICDMSLLIHNKRIIGYTLKKGLEIIIVTDGNNIINMGNQLADFIAPTNQTRYFDYIYHSNKYPKVWNKELIYCPMYLHYKYYNGEIYDKYMKRE